MNEVNVVQENVKNAERKVVVYGGLKETKEIQR